MNRVAILLGGALLVLACGANPGRGQIVDGFPLGDPITLAAGHEDLQSLALQALDTRDPGHPAVASVSTFRDDLTNQTIFPNGPATRSGTVTVFLFTFVDGSHAATGVHCGVPPCMAFGTYPH